MITITTQKSKFFSQISYNKMINDLPFHNLTCTCSQKGSLIKHGYYTRFVKIYGELCKLKILRLICKCCNKTHAILPDWIVPYSRILLNDFVAIILAYQQRITFEPIMIENLLIDENNIRYIIKQFKKYWKERLTAFKIHLHNQLFLEAKLNKIELMVRSKYDKSSIVIIERKLKNLEAKFRFGYVVDKNSIRINI